jgi:cardiolipin synthase A/B
MNSILVWVLGTIIVLAILLLIALYIRGTFRDRVEYKVKNPPTPGEPRFAIAQASLSNSLITSALITDVWNDAPTIQQVRLDAIARAQNTIHFETFFMTPGRRASDFAAAISERAAAGVEVKLLVDSYGTKKISDKYWNRLKAAGVKVLFFNPFDWKAPANYAGRTHRKLLTIDSQVAYIGGAGISDFWDGEAGAGEKEPWFDCEFRIEGEMVAVLEGVFAQHWTYAGGVADLGPETFKMDRADKPQVLVTPGFNPTYRFSPIRALFHSSLLAARERIWLASPYFFPDLNSRDMLIAAKKSGLDVKILTTSAVSDKKNVYYASYEGYGPMLAGGVEIYEYQPSMTHAKLLLIDDRWITTGSANFDPRSFFHNDELDFSTGEPNVINEIEQIFKRGFSKAKLARLEDWQKRSLWKRMVGRTVRFFEWQL